MEGKEYDLLLSLANNGGTTSIVDLVDAGMTTENTSFYDKDTYKKNEDVKKTFTDNEGNFNEKAFDSFYNYAAESYKQMGILQDTKKASESLTGDPKVWNKITEHNALQSATYDEDNFLISDRSKRTNSNQPKWITKVNPEYTMTSMSRGVNLSSESPWSKRELAQMSNAQDSETGEILDKPSFWTLDWRPLVRATYDEDVYDENGNLLHKKGEDKLNEDGHYYYETLGNRSVYGKDLINRWDVITDDRSWLNSIDFFDSDDKHEKNPVGSVLKMAALVGSMYAPYVGPFIAGTSVLLQVSSMLGTLGKMVTQDESSYFLNNLEAFAKMYRRDSHTDYASQNPFSSENIVGLMGDIAAQLKEQTWVFKKPAYLFGQEARLGAEYMEAAGGEATEKVIQKTIDTVFKDKFKKNFDEGIRALVKTGNPAEFETYALATKMAEREAAINFLKTQVKSNMNITSPLSKVYMTFLTTQDAYGEAIQMGIPKGEAVAYAVGYTAAEYFLLSTGVGERILPELHADKIVMRNMLRKIYSDVDAALAETAALHPEKLVGKQSIGNIIQTVKEKSIKVLNSIMPSNLEGLETEGAINFAKVLWGNAVGEMVEETSEEILADLSKEALTLYREMQGEKAINMWEGDDWVTRYTMSALGGFLGGGLNTALTNLSGGYNAIKKFGTFEGTTNDAILSIAQDPEQIKLMNKILDKMPIASSTTSFEFDDFTKQYKTTQNYKESQDYALKQTLKNLVNYTEQALKQDGAYANKDSFLNCLSQTGRDSFIKAINLNNLRNTITLDYHFQHFKNLQHQLMDINTKIYALEHKKKDSEKWTDNEKLTLDTYIEEKQNTLNQIKEYLDQKKMYDFAKTAIFEATPELNKAFKNKNFVTEGAYAEYRFGKSYKELNEVQKKIASEEYQNFKENENPEFVRAAHVIFEKLLLDNQKSIKDQLNSDKDTEPTSNFYKTLEALKLINADFDAENIEDYSSKINQNLFKDISNFIEFNAIQKALQINDTASVLRTLIDNHFDIFNDLKDLHNSGKEFFTNENLITYEQLIRDKDKDPKDITNVWRGNLGFKIQKSKIDEFLSFLSEELFNTSKENIKSYLLQKIGNELQSFNFFDPTHYAYAEALLNSVNVETEEERKVIKNILNDFQLKKKSASTSFLSNFLNNSITEETPLQLSLNTLSKIHNFIFQGDTLDFSKLKLTKEEVDNLNQIKGQIEVFQSLLWALRKDNADKDNVKGYAPLLNNINKSLNLGNSELLEITQDQANLLITDLNDYLKLIDNYIKIDDANSSQKLKQETAKRTKDTVGIVKFLTENLQNTSLGKEDKIKQLCPTIYSFIENTKLPSFDSKVGYDIDKETQIKFIQEKELLENHIYDVFHSEEFYDTKTNTLKEDALFSLLDNLTFPDLSNSVYKSSTISENKEVLPFLNYIIRVSAFKSPSFYNSYKEYLKENSNLAAIYEQEICIHSALAEIINSKYVNTFSKVINNKINKILQYPSSFKTFFGFYNTAFIEGYPGVGKTQGCIPQILKIIQKANPEILKNSIFAHISERNAQQFTEALKEKIDITIQPKTLESVLEMFYTDYKSYTVKGDIKESNNVIDVDDDGNISLKPEIQAAIVTDCPKIIFLDEFSRLTNIDCLLLEQAALKNGFVILGTGDTDQIKNIAELGDTVLTNRAYNFFSPEKISLIMRAENNLIADALLDFQEINESLTTQLPQFKSFKYVQNEGVFAGVKNYNINNFDVEFNNLVNNVMTPTDTLFIISPEQDLNKYKAKISGLKNVQVYTLEEVQGLEADYVIDTKQGYGAKDFDKLYTAFSRAKKGALLAFPKVMSYKVNSFRKEVLSEAFIQKTNSDVINLYDSLENKESITKDTFVEIQKDTSKSSIKEENKEGFSTEKEAQDFLNSLSISESKIEWQKIEDPQKTIITEKDYFKIKNKEGKYFIVVDYTDELNNTHEEEDLNDFLSIWEIKKEDDDVIDKDPNLKDPVEPEKELPLVNEKGDVVSSLFSFTSIPAPPSNYGEVNKSRIDNWIGLNKLNSTKYKTDNEENTQNTLKALLNFQNIFFIKRDGDSTQKEESLKKDVLLNLQGLIKGSGNKNEIQSLIKNAEIKDIKLEYYILHHFNSDAGSKTKQAYYYRESKNLFGTETDNDDYPSNNLEVNIRINDKSVFQLSLASIQNFLSYGHLLEKGTDSDLSFIQEIYNRFGKKEILAESFRTNSTQIWDYIKNNILNNSKITDETKKKAKYFYILGKLFVTNSAFGNQRVFPLSKSFILNIDKSIKNELYRQDITDFKYTPKVQPLDSVLEQYKKGLIFNGCTPSETVYVALKDFPDIGLEKGTHFIIYSNLPGIQPEIQNLIDSEGNKKYNAINWYAVLPKNISCKELILNLKNRLSGVEKTNFYGTSAHAFYILKYLIENSYFKEGQPLHEKLKKIAGSQIFDDYFHNLKSIISYVEKQINTGTLKGAKYNTVLINILNNLTLKNTGNFSFPHKTPISKIINSLIVNLLTGEEEDTINEDICNKIDEQISQGKIPYIYRFISTAPNAIIDGIYPSAGTPDLYNIKGRFERPVLTSTTFTDSVLELLQPGGELTFLSSKKTGKKDKPEENYLEKLCQKLNIDLTNDTYRNLLESNFSESYLQALNNLTVTEDIIKIFLSKGIFYINLNNKTSLLNKPSFIGITGDQIQVENNQIKKATNIDNNTFIYEYQDSRVLERCENFENITINSLSSNYQKYFKNEADKQTYEEAVKKYYENNSSKSDNHLKSFIVIDKKIFISNLRILFSKEKDAEIFEYLNQLNINLIEINFPSASKLLKNSNKEIICLSPDAIKNLSTEFKNLKNLDDLQKTQLNQLEGILNQNQTTEFNLKINDNIFKNNIYEGTITEIDGEKVTLKNNDQTSTITFNELQHDYKKLNEKCLKIINM